MRSYMWSAIFAWGLTASVGVFCFSGAVGTFMAWEPAHPLLVVAFAAMIAFAIGLVNLAAAGAMHAFKHSRRDWATLISAAACAIALAVAANNGLHLGWDLMVARGAVGVALPDRSSIDFLFYVCAFAKPAISWVIEGRKAMDRDMDTQSTANPAGEIPVTAVNLDDERRKREIRQISRNVTRAEVAAASIALAGLNVSPSYRTLAEHMQVSRARIERVWPKGVAFPRTDEEEAAAARAA